MTPSRVERVVPIVAAVFVVAMSLGYWWSVCRFLPTPEHRAAFGDMFGGLGAVFSGLAFAGLIVAIVLQGRELKLQREELQLTRSEMELARQQYSKSAEAQEELVEKQLLTARIQGVAAIVQGRYQYAAALGANSSARLGPVRFAEEELLKLLELGGWNVASLRESPFPR